MFDSQKRRTLKLLGGTSLGASGVVVAGALNAGPLSLIPNANDAASSGKSSTMPADYGRKELGIQIVNSNGVVENTALLTNNTQSDLTIKRFLPSTVVFNEKSLDLNALLPTGGLTLVAGQTIAIDTVISKLSAQAVVEYVWAEHAVQAIGNETEVVNLGAFFADHQAIVFADPLAALVA